MDQVSYPNAMVVPDEASLSAERRFLISTRIQLALLVAAGGMGAINWKAGAVDVAALIAGLGLATAALVRLMLSRTQPHRRWYEGRAAAESIKTLAWRFAVGGDPFPLTLDQPGAMFARRALELVNGLASVPLEARSSSACQPTGWMEATRDRPLAERADAYRGGRIRDQRDWYTRKAEWNRVRARFWGAAVVVLLTLAAAGAFMKAFGVIDFDMFGLSCAAVGAAAAWSETKQHATLATAYRVAAEELTAIEALVAAPQQESEWAGLVAGAEEAISREHTTWKASSVQRKPAELA